MSTAVRTPRPVAALVVVAMDEEARPFLDTLAPLDDVDEVPLLGIARAWSLALPGAAAAGGGERATVETVGPDAEPGGERTDAAAGGPHAEPDNEPGDGRPSGPRELVLVRSGIGLVAAASALATALTRLAPAVVLSAGTTGGLGREVEVGDVCVSTTLAYTDADATAFGYAHGQTPGQPAVFEADAAVLARVEEVGPAALRASTASSGGARIRAGQMLAGNSFVTAANVGRARELFPGAVSTDMESTALAQVAASAGISFASVRGVSDLCGPEAGQDFHIGVHEAAVRSAAVVLAALG
ncbi:5'-methylthioadenosine/S-adenosylhomocysteine nucleosidase [Actinomyces dentalis]|uniref:5'-methylthioadenosine/S-adenosylhomocysteine nucleosidase n=1 Tax=Actinomyces dentalis TaxID=272548 RepID=UPI0028E1D86D|nr:5'-methylthioadenosine/S-adenosylhomocysteine nucleosidase [Actinomyces dentalis]